MRREYIESQHMLKNVGKVNPDDPATLIAQMHNYRVIGEEELYRETYQRVISISYAPPTSVENHAAYNRALAHQMSGNYESALVDYQAILQDYPTYFVAYLGAANALIQLKRYGEAGEVYQEAAPLAAENPIRETWLHIDWGRLYEQRGEWDAALNSYKQALELDTGGHSSMLVLFRLAKFHAARGDQEQAIAYYHELTEARRHEDWAHGLYSDFSFEFR